MAQSGNGSLRSSLASGHDYISEYCCDLCESDGLQKEAVGFCADCQDYLCTECFNTHLRPKPMRHHVLLNHNQMPKDQQHRSGGDTCTEACTTHPHKTVEYFCTLHDELGCSVCMTLNHRNCKDVEHIPDIAGNILNNKTYEDIQMKIASLTHVANTAVQSSQDQSALSEDYHTNFLDDFKQLKTDLIETVETIEKNLVKEADTIKSDDKQKIKALENKYEDLLKDMQALSSKFTSLENNGQFCQLFIAIKRATRDTYTIETRLGHLKQNIKARDYRLIPGREVQLLIDSPETMVKLEVERQAHQITKKTSKTPASSPKQHTASVTSQFHVPATSGSPAMHGRQTRAHHVIDVRVRSLGDNKIPDITGCIVLPGDKLVVVYYNNSKVKQIDLAYNTIVSHLELPCTVLDIAQMGSTRVAVTSCDTQKIYVVNVQANQLKLEHEVNVKGQCRGIASMSDNLLVSYDKPVKVEIINMKGQVLHTVISEDKGSQRFSSPLHVAVSKNQQDIYISDWDRYTITRVNLKGHVQATYTNDKLVCPGGLAVDGEGSVYVCGWSSSIILRINADLTDIQELIRRSDGVVNPESVYYCDATCRLYIGMADSDVMKVYQLK